MLAHGMTFDGHDIHAEFGLTILDGYDLGLPTPKSYVVDLPGASGFIDLSEFGGDVAYGARTQSFVLARRGLWTQQEAEKFRTSVASVMHGVSADITYDMDPGYTYHGRATLGTVERYGDAISIPVTVNADPWKLRDLITLTINAAGGVDIVTPNGRRRQCPTIEVNHHAVVAYQGTSWELEPGAHRINDLWLEPGESVLTINTRPEWGDKTIADYAAQTIADVAKAYPRIQDAAAGGDAASEPDTMSSHAAETIETYASRRIVELNHPAIGTDAYAAYIQFRREYL